MLGAFFVSLRSISSLPVVIVNIIVALTADRLGLCFSLLDINFPRRDLLALNHYIKDTNSQPDNTGRTAAQHVAQQLSTQGLGPRSSVVPALALAYYGEIAEKHVRNECFWRWRQLQRLLGRGLWVKQFGVWKLQAGLFRVTVICDLLRRCLPRTQTESEKFDAHASCKQQRIIRPHPRWTNRVAT